MLFSSLAENVGECGKRPLTGGTTALAKFESHVACGSSATSPVLLIVNCFHGICVHSGVEQTVSDLLPASPLASCLSYSP